jgi:hypothetical protein
MGGVAGNIPSYTKSSAGFVEANMAGALLKQDVGAYEQGGNTPGMFEALGKLGDVADIAAEANPATRVTKLKGIVDALKDARDRHVPTQLASMAVNAVGVNNLNNLTAEVRSRSNATGGTTQNADPRVVEMAQYEAKRAMAKQRVEEWKAQNQNGNSFMQAESRSMNPVVAEKWTPGVAQPVDATLEKVFLEEKNNYVAQFVADYEKKLNDGQIKVSDVITVINDPTKPPEIRDALKLKFPQATPELTTDANNIYSILNAGLDSVINPNGTINHRNVTAILGQFRGATPGDKNLLRKKIAMDAFNRRDDENAKIEEINEAKTTKSSNEWKLSWQNFLKNSKIGMRILLVLGVPALVFGGATALALGGIGIGAIGAGLGGILFGGISEAAVLHNFTDVYKESKAMKEAKDSIKSATKKIRELEFNQSLTSEAKKDIAVKYAAGFVSTKLKIDVPQAAKVVSDNNGVGNLGKLMQAIT